MSEPGVNEPYGKPLPNVRPVEEPFWAAARHGELRLQRCGSCGSWRFPVAEYCPRCLSTGASWEPVAGTGTIFMRTFMHRAYFPSFAGDLPYNVVWVRLDEGPLLTGNVVGAGHDEIVVGAPVRVVFDPVTPDVTLPRFELR
jgi:uncharacterized OB-fold protein